MIMTRHQARVELSAPKPSQGCEATDPALPRRVLIVDDDPSIREMLSLFLDNFGFVVAQAANGREALAQFERQGFDLVVTDLKMPVMDGLTLTARIKALSQQTPVVIISGRIPESHEQIDAMDSASAILRKPFRLDTFQRTLQTVLSA